MRNLILAAFSLLSLPAAAPVIAPRPACAARVEMTGFRALLEAGEQRRVLSYMFELRNLTDAALLVQPSFVPPFGGAPVPGTPVMLRAHGQATASLPAEATQLAGQHGLDLAAVMGATRARCTIG